MSAPLPPPLGDLAPTLLAWYRRERRQLPWRERPEPWGIWVSEVMLQQTAVEVVVPYWRRFMARFPDPAALAAAGEEAVLAAWAGLGYYRRARLLHRGAAAVCRRGGMPRTAAELVTLPGIGSYTAAAVASIAFGEAVPVLDGNVERVTARLLAEEEDPRRAAARRRLRASAAELLVPGQAGDSNQALMELGALVCLPRRPRCGACPLAGVCRGAASGAPERFPPPKARRTVVRVPLLALRVERAGRILLFRRGAGETVLAGTWELPWVEADGAHGEAAAALAGRYGGRWEIGEELGRVRHTITFRRLEARLHRGAWRGGGDAEAGWFAAEEVAALPVSSLVGKALALGAGGTDGLPARGRRPGRPRG